MSARAIGEASRLGASAAAAIRGAIALAGGREVCFVATLDDDGALRAARVVARGDARSVLALPGFAVRGEMLVHNHPSGLLEPSDADLEVAAHLHTDGIGMAIVDNEASTLYVVLEVPRERTMEALDARAVGALLGAGGPVAASLEQWEDRPSQRAMAERIAKLYNGGGVAMFEAGTGVGKSLGYLVPALRWAAANKERTVVSTNTINLQEQLVGKDLPFLKEALEDQPVRFALLKGWHNYVCLQRLEQAADAPALFEESRRDEVAALRAWASRTTDGSLSDLPVAPRPEIWDEIAAESDLCGRLKCPHFDACFLFRARRAAAEADVIIVNHHLLLADLAVRRVSQNWGDAAVLPAYQRLVIDEGHHLEDAAVHHLGTSVTRRALERSLARLDRRGKGLLPALVARLSEHDDLLSTASLDLVDARLAPAVHAAREKGALVFDLLAMVLQESGTSPLRLTADFAAHPAWRGGLEAALTDLLREIAMLREGLRLVRERMETDERRAEEVAPLLAEMRGVARRLEGIGDGLTRALRPPPPEAPPIVRWLEARGRERNVAAVAVPLDVAPILREDLFGRIRTSVLTSATLTSDGRFDFVAERLGLDTPELEPETAVFPSPFDYGAQAVLAVPEDIPAPNADPQGHRAMLGAILGEVADASDGGLFALFTSHAEVRAAAEMLRAAGADARWPLLVHGDEARDVLLARFRASGRAVLLGTASFWEGVDVAGDALRALVIAKLPFRVPTEPLTAAHCEAIADAGGDPFAEYMLPHATLRLKQGFGRLIRRTTDRGAIVLADPRVLTKGYGASLLDALPPARRVIAPWAQVRRELRRFYDREHP